MFCENRSTYINLHRRGGFRENREKKYFERKIEVIFSLGISNFEIYRDKYNKPVFI